MRFQGIGLRGNYDFLRLWIAQTVSIFGSQITLIALPLIAILTLQVTPAEMGMLRAVNAGSSVLAGLFVGLWIDRLRRRPILVVTNIGMAIIIGSIPIAALAGVLNIGHLYVVQFLSGSFSTCSDIALMAFLPSLLQREQIVEGNIKLQATTSVASIGGPAVAGALVPLLTAPIAIVLDALSFLFSGLFIWLIRTHEPRLAVNQQQKNIWLGMGEGLKLIFGNPVLRPLAESIAAHFLFGGMIFSIFLLYAIRELAITPARVGVVFAAFGAGSLLGAIMAARIARAFGVGPAMLGALLLHASASILILLANGAPYMTLALLMASHLIMGFCSQVYGIHLISLRQAVTPNWIQGRMNACYRTVSMGALAIGSFCAGKLGEAIDLRTALIIGSVGLFTPLVPLLLSPVRSLRSHHPAPEDVGTLQQVSSAKS